MFVWQKIYFKDVLTGSFIALSPLLIYIHLFFDSTKEQLLIFGWHSDHCFISEQQFVWYLMIKLIPILLFSIWFTTSKFNWNFLILLPIILFSDSLMRYTILPDTYSMGLILIISFISNIMLILLLVSIKKFNKKLDNNGIGAISLIRAMTNKTRRNYNLLVQIISQVKEINFNNQSINYFQNLVQLHNYVDDVNEYSEQYKLKDNRFRILFLIYALFLIMPFIFNIHHLVPDESLSLDIYFIHVPSFGFPNVDIFIWLFFIKITFALGLCLWFITCEHWWKYAIMSPLVLVSYQIWEMFQNVQNIDAWGNLKAVPFLILILFVLIKISDYVKYQFMIIELHNSIKNEFEAVIKSKADLTSFEQMKIKLDNFRRSGKISNSFAQELETLNKMKEKIIREIDINY